MEGLIECLEVLAQILLGLMPTIIDQQKRLFMKLGAVKIATISSLMGLLAQMTCTLSLMEKIYF